MTDLFSDSPSPSVLPSADRVHGRDAEHALVAALVLGHAEPADLSGRLAGRDFFDPAAWLIFDTILECLGLPTDGCRRTFRHRPTQRAFCRRHAIQAAPTRHWPRAPQPQCAPN